MRANGDERSSISSLRDKPASDLTSLAGNNVLKTFWCCSREVDRLLSTLYNSSAADQAESKELFRTYERAPPAGVAWNKSKDLDAYTTDTVYRVSGHRNQSSVAYIRSMGSS